MLIFILIQFSEIHRAGRVKSSYVYQFYKKHNILISVNYFSADELLLTEMVFNGVFNDLNAEQTVSLLSCFVFQEKVVYRYWLFKIYQIAK